MTAPRTTWLQLPAAVRTAVERHVGCVTAAVPISNGLNSPFAARLHTRNGPTVFAKGAPDGPAARVHHEAEFTVSAWRPPSSPRLIARVRVAAWDVLLMEHVDGRHAELSPGSPDLDLVSAALLRTSAAPPGGLAPPLASRFSGHLQPGDAELLDGRMLLHTDLHRENILIGPDRGVHFVDWAMPAIGPAWAEVAYLALYLVSWERHTLEQALAWAYGLPAWRGVHPDAVDAFVRAECSLWRNVPGCDVSSHRNATLRALSAGVAGGCRLRAQAAEHHRPHQNAEDRHATGQRHQAS